MNSKKEETCPSCKGEKIIEGVCECDMEWRGNKAGDYMDDCQCSPDEECTTCFGKGYLVTFDDG